MIKVGSMVIINNSTDDLPISTNCIGVVEYIQTFINPNKIMCKVRVYDSRYYYDHNTFTINKNKLVEIP